MKHGRAWLALTFAAAVGCGDSDPPVVPGQNVGDAGGIGRIYIDAGWRPPGRDGGAGDGGAAEDGGGSNLILTATITDPKEASLVEAKPITPRVEVVIEGGSGVYPNVEPVQINVFPAAGMRPAEPLATARLERSGSDGTDAGVATLRFGGQPLDLAKLESGEYEIEAIVRVGGAEKKTTIKIRVDSGPRIEFVRPSKEGEAYRGATDIEVRITDALFPTVSDVEISIGKTKLTNVKPPTAAGVYAAHVNFSEGFDPPLDGEQLITVRAKNGNGTESVATWKFVVDNDGPLFKNVVPKEAELIGQIIDIKAEITDPSGVVESSVKAVIGHGGTDFVVELSLLAGSMPPTYRARFDTRLLPVNAIYPSISFRAKDNLGNESALGYLLKLDNTPPMSDLDPPEDFRGMYKDQTRFVCSWPFDPVGPDAVDDGDRVNQAFDIRARVEDRGNEPLEGTADVIPISGVPAGGAQLYVLQDTSRPLVVDSNGDGFCDMINPELVPTTMPMSSKDALRLDLAPITPSSAQDQTPDPSLIGNPTCAPGGATMLPDPLCETTINATKTRWQVIPGFGVVPHSHYTIGFVPYSSGNLPSIWGLPEIKPGELCGGTQFDALGSSIRDGWSCLAVAAKDGLGNMQVSRVIRVCVDKDGKNNECPHVGIASVSSGTPMVVTTATDHGYQSGASVYVSGVFHQTGANKTWLINVTGPRTFSLVGSAGIPELPDGSGGRVVLGTQLPDCSGTAMKQSTGLYTVASSPSCAPWRTFKAAEIRRF